MNLYICYDVLSVIIIISKLTKMFSESEGSGGAIPVHHVDSAFLEKITDFLKYFVAFHLKRCELNNQV